ncbi:MAG TPA: rhodanese-like domain-containing protein [Acidobacteriaceae bacterium]
MIFERFIVPGLSQYSYIVGEGSAVAVIDPKRDIDTYLDYADSKSLRIAYVLETHIHADYASGARALAEACGAELCLSGYDEGETFQYAFQHRKLKEGDDLSLGGLTLRTLHTPGHTPEHISFLLSEPRRSSEPLALFSGDFLFVGSVGRPDLLGEEEKQGLARALYASVQRLENLPDGLLVFPGHGPGSLCGAGMAQREQSTLGYERSSNPFLQKQSEETFVETVLSTVLEFPDYYQRMKTLNSAGPPILDGLPGGERIPVKEFEQKQKELDAIPLDLRRPEAFGGAHIPGSINIGVGPNLSVWAPWVLPYDRPILLIGDATTDMETARRALIRVGLDNAVGSLRGGISAWLESGRDQGHVPQASVQELHEVLEQPGRPLLLDVRSPGEWKTGHIDGAVHISGGDLPKHLTDLPADKPLYVICGSGYRSSIAVSILARSGRTKPTNVDGGMSAWKNQHFPVVEA